MFAEFDYTSGCKLSRQEVIFYFTRLSAKGVYLALFKEFQKELRGGEYSILPLVRPTSSNEELSLKLMRAKETSINRVVQLADDILRTRSSGNQEVVLRQGSDRSTMYNMKRQGSAQAAVDMILGTAGESQKKARVEESSLEDIHDFDVRALMTETVVALRAIASKEKISLKGKIKKHDIARAIYDSRQVRLSK